MEKEFEQRQLNDAPFQDQMFQEKEIHLSEYVDILFKRKTLIISVFILILLATVYSNSRLVPIYQSTAQLVIDKEKTVSPITGNRMMGFESYMSAALTFKTHIVLIKSSQVIENVVKALDLDQIEPQELEISWFRKMKTQLKENIKLLFKKSTPEIEKIDDVTVSAAINKNSAERKLEVLIGSVRSKIMISEVQDTRLLDLIVKDMDPEMAANIANTLSREYIRFNLSNQLEASRENLAWLNQELYQLKKNLEDDERTFFEYKQQSKLFSVEGKQMQVTQKISDFNNRYLEARNQRVELDSKIAELERHLKNSKGLAKVRSLVNNPFIDELYNKINTIEINYSKMSKVYKAKHPKVVQLKSELAKSQKRLDDELAKELINLKSQRTVLKAREDILEKTIVEFEQDALDTSGKELEYTILQRNLTASQNLYNVMLTRIKETDIMKNSDPSNIRIVEQAMVPSWPVAPNKRRNFMLGIVLGIMGGCGLAFFLEYLDQTIRTEEDVQSYLNLPVLSVVPEADKSSGYGYTYGAGK